MSIGDFVRFESVRREFKAGAVPVVALDGLTFGVAEGGFCVITGPSGSGKTTALNILGGMDFATDGRVVVGGRDITALGARARAEYRRRDVGFVFQFYNLIPNLTALENVELAGFVNPNSQNAQSVLTAVGLGELSGHFPSQLSGGEQQRVAIARALAKGPRLLLCDEPTGALDCQTGKAILKLLWETSKASNVTVIIITHNQAIAPMAGRVVKIRSGRAVDIADQTPVPIEDIQW